MTLVFTTTTADAMARQCATFLKEYCNKTMDCSKCAFGKHCADQDICCPLGKLPELWEVDHEEK